MNVRTELTSDFTEQLKDALSRHWGFEEFRPLQLEAMLSVMDGRDSLAVLPTGGGKSLCYQAPAMCMDGLAVVVSPLIALMKDQVDALTTAGIPAAAVNSSMSVSDRRRVMDRIQSGELKLLYLAPERLLIPRTIDFLKQQQLSFFAVDEAHCISEWGHDFRPDYRGLSSLKTHFPRAAIHAYTATATQQVRTDIVEQLGLNSVVPLVGSFLRSNLQYHVLKRESGNGQILELLERFRGQSGIVYCLTRDDVDRVSGQLNDQGFSARPYHAGMSDRERSVNQEAFLAEHCDIIVATVAFGMGIDKSNVRFVIHAAMPRSLENYQQESGRAGRDGAEAECWLLYSGADLMKWKHMTSDLSGHALQLALRSLDQMYGYCTSHRCRHASLIEHFGQQWEAGSCGACDVCLGTVNVMDDALIISQKILSCVVRVCENFGADYVAKVLTGSRDQRILNNGHDQLSTYSLLSEYSLKTVRQWIEQLAGQGFLSREGEYRTLAVTESGRRVFRGEQVPALARPTDGVTASSASGRVGRKAPDSWEGVDQELFEILRTLRREVAGDRRVPAYVVFGDVSLRDMARRRPSTDEAFLQVHGVGQQKAKLFRKVFLDAIVSYCRDNGVATDATGA
ncbi:MAG: DNA helicase RecQ [Planctomycetaceae bacterium]